MPGESRSLDSFGPKNMPCNPACRNVVEIPISGGPVALADGTGVQSVFKKEIPIQSIYSLIYGCSAFKRLFDLANSCVIFELDFAHIL